MKLMNVELTHDNGTDLASWSTTDSVQPAEAFDRLIRVLAETRRTMAPAFPDTLPVLIKAPPQVDGPAWQWSMQPDGGLILNILHPGLGWLGFRMPDVDRFHENLATVLDQRNTLRAELEPSSKQL